MTDALAAKVGGGGAEGCHKTEENQMPAILRVTGSHLGQGLQLGKGQRQQPKCRVTPRAGTRSWDSGPRAGIFPSFLILAACVLAGINSVIIDKPQTPVHLGHSSPDALCKRSTGNWEPTTA